MNAIATNEKMGPRTMNIGIISLNGGTTCERLKIFSVCPKKKSLKALALIEAINIGAIARSEKWRKIAS
tara:strand:+ start:673 stop:879 length:207 start_codon:yes stop_codon:yes gene_type:complete